MSRKIIGVTVGTTISPEKMAEKINSASIVWVTVTDNGDGTYSADKTCSQIKEAHEANVQVGCKWDGLLLPLTSVSPVVCTFGSTDGAEYFLVRVNSNNLVTVATFDLLEDAGPPGADGVSVTHKWIGTVLEVTSASGTASADLKGEKGDKGNPGEKGDKGDKGDPGSKGADGYTPVKGTDYYTPEDKAEFEDLIADEMAKRGQLKPEFANSIEECTDTTKVYVLPDGYLYAYVTTEVTEEVITYTNQLPLAKDADGNLYNGGQGWKTNTRLSSSGAESTSSATGMEATGFIPFKKGDIIRFSGIIMNANSTNNQRCYFIQYDANKTKLKDMIVSAFNTAISSGHVLVDDDGNILQINTDMIGDENSSAIYPIYSNAAFFRISADEINADSIITINEEIKPTIVTTKTQAWANTGHAFVPADYEGRIVVILFGCPLDADTS